MTLIKSRESADADKPAESGVEGEIREFVRRDVAGLRRQPENDAIKIRKLLEAIAQMCDRELVARLQSSDLDPHAINLDTVGATEVAHQKLTVFLRNGAMVSRHAK